MYAAGFDIGGTKCSITLSEYSDKKINILNKSIIKTTNDPIECIDSMIEDLNEFMLQSGIDSSRLKAGISCGGPLSSKDGIIINPPNLPGRENFSIVEYIYIKTGIKANLINDADACAVAEWKYGAGRGKKNIIFLTFGTGMGAGLILNNKLYNGANDMAGEVGHIRLNDTGPMGYGKNGSFEGYCSGGGIRQQGIEVAKRLRKDGLKASFDNGNLDHITAKSIAESAFKGNEDAIEIYDNVGAKLGYGLSILIDILNPDMIIIGGIYQRSSELMKNSMFNTIKKESLSISLNKLQIVESELRENIGDYGAICAALI